MELICLSELTDVERIGLFSAIAFGLIIFLLGVILAFQKRPWKEKVSGRVVKIPLSLPAPLACIVLGVVVVTVGAGFLANKFPTESISFSQKPWTLSEIKERIERVSRLRIDVKREAASFAIDKQFSGACASDVLISICDFYPSKLLCKNDAESGTFVIATRP